MVTSLCKALILNTNSMLCIVAPGSKELFQYLHTGMTAADLPHLEGPHQNEPF